MLNSKYQLQLNPYYHFEIVKDEGIIAIGEKSTRIITHKLYVAIIEQFLNGLSVTEIIKKLEQAAENIYYAILILTKQGYLIEKIPAYSFSQCAYFSTQDITLSTLTEEAQQTSLEIKNLTDRKCEFESIITSSGYKIASNANIIIVVVESYLSPLLKDYIKTNFNSNKKFLLFKPFGTEVLIGPLLSQENHSVCFPCLHKRMLRINKELAWVQLRNEKNINVMGNAYNYNSLSIATNLLALELNKLIGKADHTLNSHIRSFDLNQWHLQNHKIIPYPNCLHCARNYSEIKLTGKIDLKDCLVSDETTNRSISAEETIKRYQHLVSHVCGIIKYLKPFHYQGLHLYISGMNFAVNQHTLMSFKNSLRDKCAGKGATEIEARVGALAEALERYSGEYQGFENSVFTRYEEIKDKAINPSLCMQFSEQQYREKNKWRSMGSNFTWVPDPIDISQPLDWTAVWSLSANKFKYLPTKILYYFFNEPNPFASNSNGAAAGNTIEEAILQGLYEVIERDCVAIWWYNRIHMPAVDLTSFKNNFIDSMIQHYRDIARELWVLDITNDLKIPTFVALSRNTNNAEHIMMGFGTHLNPLLAIIRAITEHNQMVANLKAVLANGNETDSLTFRWLKEASILSHPYLYSQKPPKTVYDYCNTSTINIKTDILYCKKIIEDAGLELLVLNQTRVEVQMPVVKVIVPGLRHFWPRFAPGRLYDVPVKMGWLKQALAETDLNPFPMFL